MLLWVWAFGTSSVLMMMGLLTMIGAALVHHVIHDPGHSAIGAVFETVLGWLAVALLGILTFHAGVVANEMQNDHRSTQQQISILSDIGEPRRLAGIPTRRIEWEEPLAVASPRHGHVIYSSSLEQLLTHRQLCATVAHEWAHITRHHNRLLAVGRFASTSVPFLSASKRLMQVMRIATELEADDIAASRFGSDALADALSVSYPTEIGVEERVIRLRSGFPTKNK